MYSAKGYMPAAYVRQSFTGGLRMQLIAMLMADDSIMDWLIKKSKLRAGWDSEITSESKSRILRNLARDHADTLAGIAFRSFLRRTDLFLVGPSEEVQPVQHEITQLFWGYYPVGEIDWAYLTKATLSVDAETRVRAAEAAKFLMGVPHAASTERFLDDLAASQATARSLLPFQGWALAIAEADAPDECQRRTYLGLPAAEGELGGSKKNPRKGRPRKREAAAEAYMARFPGGHGEYKWEEVLRILEVEDGILVGVETLRAGIASLTDGENIPK